MVKLRLFCRRECWVLTTQGWLFGLSCFLVLLIGLGATVRPWLAVQAPIQAEVLVVEGWLTDKGLEAAIAEFKRGHYQKLLTTGGPVAQGFYLAEYKTYADLSAATLVKLGLNPDQLAAVPAPYVTRNRTYTSAMAVRHWLETTGQSFRRINLYSYDVHARRSWIIFQKALAPQIQVGVLALPPEDYDGDRWWISSAGTKTIFFELIAWVYANLFNSLD